MKEECTEETKWDRNASNESVEIPGEIGLLQEVARVNIIGDTARNHRDICDGTRNERACVSKPLTNIFHCEVDNRI